MQSPTTKGLLHRTQVEIETLSYCILFFFGANAEEQFRFQIVGSESETPQSLTQGGRRCIKVIHRIFSQWIAVIDQTHIEPNIQVHIQSKMTNSLAIVSEMR